jgi:pantoate kinase
MNGKAFAPGHITGFFEIFDRPADPLRKGSRGAGVNLSLGVLTTVDARPSGRQSIDILLNGRKAPADTTLHAVRQLIGRRKLQVRVRSDFRLPVGQGLGMSAAGALSAALALSSALGLPQTLHQAARAAHSAEITSRTGLGDVAGQLRGGWEIRVRPGLPPHGLVDRILAPGMPIIICVSGAPVPTKGVLSDPAMRRSINRVGRGCMEAMLRRPTLDNFFRLSKRFARLSGLASRESLHLVEEIRKRRLGMAGVSMIGNSVFAVGDIPALAGLMKGHGRVIWCSTDLCGAAPVV